MKRVFIFLGPPGSGKGTQTSRLAQKLNLPHIDTGSLLRENVKNGTAFGLEAKKYMDRGELVPVQIVQDIIAQRLKEPDAKAGYILDGFPRSLEQAHILERIQEELKTYWKDEDIKTTAIYFDVPMDILVQRLVNRRSCPKCGKIYNLINKKPLHDNVCDTCDVELVQRADDNEKTALLRFKTYEEETKPLLRYFRDKGLLKEINANLPIEEVWEEIVKIAG